MKRELKDIFIDDLRMCASKRVLVRLDWNVALDKDGVPLETSRITKTFPLIEQLSLLGAIVIIISHIGEDGGSLKPVADFVKDKVPFTLFLTTRSFSEINTVLAKATPGQVYILENIRTFEGEMENTKSFAQNLASLAQIYINDAFSVSHRKQASIISLPQHILSYAGPLFKSEVDHLTPLLKPELPTLFIIGGAKIRTKLSLIQEYLQKGAYVFIGGAMVHNALKQIGIEIGKSLYEPDYLVPEEVIQHPHLLLPVDVITKDGESHDIHDVQPNDVIVDCGKLTVELLTKHIAGAKTIIMNGPVGLYEEGFKYGTEMILSHIGHNHTATTILGGGDTLSVLEAMHTDLDFTFVSMAGGAMLTYLTEGTLVGIEALKEDVTL